MDKTIWFILPNELYIIRKVRAFRLDLGISAPEISVFLNKNKKYIGNIESSAHNSTYSDDILSEIAVYFSQRALDLQSSMLESGDTTIIKTAYSIYDFYPKEILSDERVIKKIDPIPLGSGPTVTLNALIEHTDFFKVTRTLKEIVDKCNKVQNQNWGASDFTKKLDSITKGKKKKLQVILKNGLNTYIMLKES